MTRLPMRAKRARGGPRVRGPVPLGAGPPARRAFGGAVILGAITVATWQ